MLCCHLRQWDGHLRDMRRGDGHRRADGDVAVNDIHVQLVSDPTILVDIDVALAANIAAAQQVREALVQATVGL